MRSSAHGARIEPPPELDEVRFRILGPLEIASDDGRPVAIGGKRVGVLLAALLLHRGELVPADRLIEELWGAESPDDPRGALQAAASRLRKAIGADRLVSRAGGYAVVVRPGELDADQFEALAREGRQLLDAGDCASAAARLREALALWRGPALVDFAYESFAQSEISRLEELRLAALEDRLEADLGAGGHGHVVAELEALVAGHPLRERFRAQLMLALYRSGRQAEALAAYRSARNTFVEELGLEPGAALQGLERAILAHDPALDLAEAGSASQARRPDDERQTVLVVPQALSRVADLLSVAWPLARRPRREVVVAALVETSAELEDAMQVLQQRRAELLESGAAVRTVAFTSAERDEDTLRLAAQERAALVVLDASPALLEARELDAPLMNILARAEADVAILVGTLSSRGGSARPVTVPFGGGEHEWRALEAAAWIASEWGAPLALIGTTADDDRGRRDASRLLATASLIAQRAAGVTATPRLAPPGAAAVAKAASGSALLVVGVSGRWEQEGIGPARLAIADLGEAPLLLVRRGERGEALSGESDLSRYTWSRGDEAG
jgi:DNA-binding SARP family transcriptional activator